MSWFKKNKPNKEAMNPEFLQGAQAGAINKRAHVRFRYPSIGPIGSLPQILVRNKPAKVRDISVGGVLLAELGERASFMVGEYYDLLFHFKKPVQKTIIQKAKLVRLTNRGGHFKYENLDSAILVNLSLASTPGMRGQRTTLIQLSPGSDADKNLAEFWAGQSGDRVLFYGDQRTKAFSEVRLTYGNTNYRFRIGDGLSKAPDTTAGETDIPSSAFTEEAGDWQLDDVILYLSNFDPMTGPIKQLTHELEGLRPR